jgi:hypothetical protein
MTDDERDLYVYALACRGLPRRIPLRGHSLRTVTVGDVDAIVERLVQAPRPTEAVLREQHDIVSALSGMTDALLPARFGTLVSRPALEGTVAARHAELSTALALVRGQSQMTVRVFGERPDPGAAAGTGGTGTSYLAARRGRGAIPPGIERIRTAVGPWTTAERVEPGGRGLLVTLFHLVAARTASRYRRAVLGVAPSLAPLRVSVSGPWPAFAFAPELFGVR